MSDDNDSGGIFGAIISAFILVAIWPYLLALLGIYIAYMVVLAILAWIAENWILIVGWSGGALGIYCLFRYKLINKAWRYLFPKIESALNQVDLANIPTGKWTPSTNLYCYWCTKKLGIRAWERNGKYFCRNCHENNYDSK
jgi:hypothetical protein